MNDRQQFAETVTRLMGEDDKIVLFLADVGTFGFRRAFEQYPERCFNTGPAEQATVGIAAGFAKEGFYPIVHSFSSFLLRRAYEQILLDFAKQELPGLLVGIHGYEKFGPSHCCPEDDKLFVIWGVSNIENIVSAREFAYVRLT